MSLFEKSYLESMLSPQKYSKDQREHYAKTRCIELIKIIRTHNFPVSDNWINEGLYELFEKEFQSQLK